MIPGCQSVHQRISHCTVRLGNGCVVWSGPKNKDGYGKLQIGGQTWMAHRAAFQLYVGPIPSDLCVCHTCDNPACVNVEHLWLGTNRDNTADKVRKGRCLVGEKHPRWRGGVSKTVEYKRRLDRKYKQEHVDDIRDRQSRYRADHREELAAKSRQRYSEKRNEILAKNRQAGHPASKRYYERHAEEVRARARAKYAELKNRSRLPGPPEEPKP